MKNASFVTRAAAAASIAALLAGCGAHSSMVPSAPSRLPSGATKATLVVKIPKHAASTQARHPAYISASTQSVTFAYSVGTTQYPAQTFNVTPTSPGCSTDSSGNTECVASFGATAGTADYTISTFDGLNGGGNLLAAAAASMTIAAGQDNRFNITLDGVPKTFKLTLSQNTVTSGTPSDIPATIAAYDSDSNLIVNSPAFWSSTQGASYDTATINSSNTSEFTVQQNGATLPTVSGDPSTYQLTMPFTNLTVHYSGTGLSVGTLTLSDPGTGISDQQAITVQEPAPTVTEYAVPWGDAGVKPSPWGIASDSNGNVWFTDDVVDMMNDNGRIGEVTDGGSFTMSGVQGYLDRGITLGPDGNFWMTNQCGPGGIDVYTTGGSFVANYPLPGAPACYTAGGQIVSGAGGNLWFTLGNGNTMGQITTSGTPTIHSFSGTVTGITNGPDGNMWFTETDAGKIGMMTAGGQLTEYPLPAGVRPYWIASGIDGNLWFTEKTPAAPYIAIGKMSTSGTYTQYDMPYTQTDPYYYGPGGIIAGPDGNLWFGDEGLLGRVDPNTGKITKFAATWGCGSNEIPRQFTVVNQTTMWFTDGDGCVGKITINQ